VPALPSSPVLPSSPELPLLEPLLEPEPEPESCTVPPLLEPELDELLPVALVLLLLQPANTVRMERPRREEERRRGRSMLPIAVIE
jgi:hypothetical protein